MNCSRLTLSSVPIALIFLFCLPLMGIAVCPYLLIEYMIAIPVVFLGLLFALLCSFLGISTIVVIFDPILSPSKKENESEKGKFSYERKRALQSFSSESILYKDCRSAQIRLGFYPELFKSGDTIVEIDHLAEGLVPHGLYSAIVVARLLLLKHGLPIEERIKRS